MSKNPSPQETISFLKQIMQDSEGKEKLIEALLDGSSQIKMAAFCNKRTGETLTLQEFIEREGREAAKKMLEDVLENMTEDSVEISRIPRESLNADKINEIMHKVQEGTATEDEQIIAKIFQDEDNFGLLQKNNSENMIQVLIGSMTEMLVFANKEVFYSPTFSDYTTALEMVMIASLCATPGSILQKYENTSMENLSTIAKKVGEDIKSACDQFWKARPNNPEFIMLGLMYWLNELCETHNFKFVEAEKIAKYYNMEEWVNGIQPEDDDIDSEIPGVTQPICHGSNDGKVVSFSDKQMKNLLKED